MWAILHRRWPQPSFSFSFFLNLHILDEKWFCLEWGVDWAEVGVSFETVIFVGHRIAQQWQFCVVQANIFTVVAGNLLLEALRNWLPESAPGIWRETRTHVSQMLWWPCAHGSEALEVGSLGGSWGVVFLMVMLTCGPDFGEQDIGWHSSLVISQRPLFFFFFFFSFFF